MSGGKLYRESTYEAVSETYGQYSKDLQGIEIIYLLPGESVSRDRILEPGLTVSLKNPPFL